LQAGPGKSSALRSQLALGAEVFDFVIEALVGDQQIRFAGEMLSLSSAPAHLSDAESERLALVERAYEQAGLLVPSVIEVAQSLGYKEADVRRLITILQRSQTIVRMGSDNLFIHSTALSRLAAQIAALRGSQMDVGRFKQLTGLSRKYAIPLLEYLDRQRVTRLQGDKRLIL
jgi:selenocysteine-specific elongation factor